MNDPFELAEKIANEILKDKDNAKAIEFTTVIGNLLRENGVTPICTEYVSDGFDNEFGYGYKCRFEKLDFTEHDKVFEDRIAKKWELIDKLYKENVRLEEKCMKKDADIDNLQCENKALEKRIAELEDKIGDRDEINRCLREQIAELESKGKIELSELPFDPLDTANYLINATYERETNGIERVVQNLPEKVISDRYTVDELEQIAEHLLIYCRHNKE